MALRSGTAVSGGPDSLGLFAAAAGLPDQIEAAARAARQAGPLPDLAPIEHVLVLGAGAAASAAAIARVAAEPLCPLPIIVHETHSLPSYVSEATLCLALSYSGETEEVLEAVEAAGASGARVVTVAGGGALAGIADEHGLPHVALDPSLPQARSAVGALAVPVLVLLERMGACAGAGEYVAAAAAHLRRRIPDLAATDGPARLLARRIGRTMPVLHAGSEVGEVAAAWWRDQINRNARTAAFAATAPQLTHSTVAGWGQHGDVTRQVFTLVVLRHAFEHPSVAVTLDRLTDELDEFVADHHVVPAAGEGLLTQLLDLVSFGDHVSLHLAGDHGVDPGPVPSVPDEAPPP